MTQPPVVGAGLDVTSRLGIENNRANDGSEVAARATSAVEHRRHPRHVLGARVARDQVLNQLLRDERTDIGMVEDVVNRVVEIL